MFFIFLPLIMFLPFFCFSSGILKEFTEIAEKLEEETKVIDERFKASRERAKEFSDLMDAQLKKCMGIKYKNTSRFDLIKSELDAKEITVEEAYNLYTKGVK